MADGRSTAHARNDVFIRVNRFSRIVLARCINSASTNPEGCFMPLKQCEKAMKTLSDGQRKSSFLQPVRAGDNPEDF